MGKINANLRCVYILVVASPPLVLIISCSSGHEALYVIQKCLIVRCLIGAVRCTGLCHTIAPHSSSHFPLLVLSLDKNPRHSIAHASTGRRFTWFSGDDAEVHRAACRGFISPGHTCSDASSGMLADRIHVVTIVAHRRGEHTPFQAAKMAVKLQPAWLFVIPM